jgi:NAD(P)H dehydrogenase (quinone)
LDSTGQIWATGGLAGKYAGVFVSTGGQGGGQEVTTISVLSTLVHHGIIFVPLGYTHALEQQGSLEEVHGGTYLWSLFNYSSIFLYSLAET